MIDAVLHGPKWASTALVWVYDEHGGFYDRTSTLKLVETKWNCPALPYRDAIADNMLDFFDFSSELLPFLDPPDLAAPLNPSTSITGPPGPAVHAGTGRRCGHLSSKRCALGPSLCGCR